MKSSQTQEGGVPSCSIFQACNHAQGGKTEISIELAKARRKTEKRHVAGFPSAIPNGQPCRGGRGHRGFSSYFRVEKDKWNRTTFSNPSVEGGTEEGKSSCCRRQHPQDQEEQFYRVKKLNHFEISKDQRGGYWRIIQLYATGDWRAETSEGAPTLPSAKGAPGGGGSIMQEAQPILRRKRNLRYTRLRLKSPTRTKSLNQLEPKEPEKDYANDSSKGGLMGHANSERVREGETLLSEKRET